MTPNSQSHPMIMSQQPHHISPYGSQQPPTMHHIHPQHSPTIVVQPPPQFSPSSVHHHQLTLNTTTGHQSPPIDPNKRQIQMPKPAQQLLVQHEPMGYDEQSIKTEVDSFLWKERKMGVSISSISAAWWFVEWIDGFGQDTYWSMSM